MSAIIDFYRGGKDASLRTLSDIMEWQDQHWESKHDFIGWVLPTPDASHFDKTAPMLTPVDIQEFKSDKGLQEALDKSFRRFLLFMGLQIDSSGNVGKDPETWRRRSHQWGNLNHNWFRVTRAIRCMSVLGRQELGFSFFQFLSHLRGVEKYEFGESFGHWRSAVRG